MENKPKTVGELIASLSSLPKDMKLVSSSDDEGNSYGYVYYDPTVGTFDGCDFETAADGTKITKGMVVCIN